MSLRKQPTSHVATADDLARAEPALRRLLAIILWLISLGGNMLAFGSPQALANDDLLWSLVGMAVGWQVLCTLVQAITCKHPGNPLYLIALAASALPSFVGYRPLVAVPLTSWFTGYQGDLLVATITQQLTTPVTNAMIGIAVVVHLLLFFVMVSVDVVPERTLIKH